MSSESAREIRDRSFKFACKVGGFSLTLIPKPGIRCIIDQLLKSGTATGANLEEVKAASTKREFIRYVEIALREARESVYWLRICLALDLGSKSDLEALRDEGEQIARILGAIVINTKRRMLMGYPLFAFCLLNFALLLS